MAAEFHGAGYAGSLAWEVAMTRPAGGFRDLAISSSAMISSSVKAVLPPFFGIVANVCKKGDRR
ncbi:hypothetical protein BG22_01610 [Bifidobacterium sp. UTBIF-78]|uniref:Uncharacterized protein n=1 Tax=Bifidobacterium myosotis TaxID=1630166 RepID=A0A261FK76_9BIFI|nr:hypothetical protein BMYO_1411 [Bifidobacterium myosotis]TPF95547.1 hypothetical protein BG22_01610 [Bifidobacterium sp. UTBIF-78]